MLAMLEWKINQSEALAGFSENVCYFFFSFNPQVTETIFGIEDRWSHISHILEREVEEFQAAMRAEISATPLYTTDLGRIESHVFTDTDMIVQ